MDVILSLLYYTLRMATPLLLCIMGGVFVQKAGTMNFALEAGINIGAFGAIVFTYLSHNLLVGILCSFLCCICLNLVFGTFVVKLHANPTIVGLSLNMLIQALPPFILEAFFPSRGYLSAKEYIPLATMKVDVPILKDIPILGQVFSGHTPLTYVSWLFVIVGTIIFYKTKFGVYVQVTGENKGAAEAVGIKTDRIKWTALIISACCCALAGMNLSVEQTGLFSLNISSARGLICLSAINCGKREPLRSAAFGLLFGFSNALKIIIANYVDPNVAEFMNVVPYLTIIIVFLFTEIPVARKNTMRIFRGS